MADTDLDDGWAVDPRATPNRPGNAVIAGWGVVAVLALFDAARLFGVAAAPAGLAGPLLLGSCALTWVIVRTVARGLCGNLRQPVPKPQPDRPPRGPFAGFLAAVFVTTLLATAIEERLAWFGPWTAGRWAAAAAPVVVSAAVIGYALLRNAAVRRRLRRAAADVRAGRKDAALAEYAAMTDDPIGRGAAITCTAILHRHAGRVAEARETALGLLPEGGDTGGEDFGTLAWLTWEHETLRELGRREEADATLGEMERRFPDQFVTRLNRVQTLRGRGGAAAADGLAARTLADVREGRLAVIPPQTAEDCPAMLRRTREESVAEQYREMFEDAEASRRRYGW